MNITLDNSLESQLLYSMSNFRYKTKNKIKYTEHDGLVIYPEIPLGIVDEHIANILKTEDCYYGDMVYGEVLPNSRMYLEPDSLRRHRFTLPNHKSPISVSHIFIEKCYDDKYLILGTLRTPLDLKYLNRMDNEFVANIDINIDYTNDTIPKIHSIDILDPHVANNPNSCLLNSKTFWKGNFKELISTNNVVLQLSEDT